MHRKHQIAALLFLGVLGLFDVGVLEQLEYYTPLGPGAGFFPFWLGCSGRALDRLACPGVRRSGNTEEGAFLPPRGGIVRILSIVVSVAVVSALMDLLGFQLTMFLFMVFMLMILGRQTLWMTVVIALLGSVGVYHLFGRYLDVPLPVASVAFLANLGL